MSPSTLLGANFALRRSLEAPSGVEPLHRSFADCSLNHLGTAPCGHYSGASSDIST